MTVWVQISLQKKNGSLGLIVIGGRRFPQNQKNSSLGIAVVRTRCGVAKGLPVLFEYPHPPLLPFVMEIPNEPKKRLFRNCRGRG
jgi:hypothetical protein